MHGDGERTAVEVHEFVCPMGNQLVPNWGKFGLKTTILRLAPKVEGPLIFSSREELCGLREAGETVFKGPCSLMSTFFATVVTSI